MYTLSNTLHSLGHTPALSATAPGDVCHRSPTRHVSDSGRLALLRWARRKDEAANRHMAERRITLEVRVASCADARLIRELKELRPYSATYLRLVELLLATDCTLQELWSLRWSDVTLTPEGLQVWLHGRKCTIGVPDGSLDGVPQVSQWVFAGKGWNRFEKQWRQLAKTVYLPEDIWG